VDAGVLDVAEATTSPRSATASSSISLALRMNLEMTTGYSGVTSEARRR
jgi:hypothetical protein